MDTVSVIVACYNPKWEKLKNTITSIIRQKRIEVEIIVADDGSVYSYENELKDLFRSFGFNAYKLKLSKKNEGTVKNLISALDLSSAEYIKVISPGDYLYDEFTLYSWMLFIKDKKAAWSFSDVCYYTEHEEVKDFCMPQELRVHMAENTQEARWNYAILGDVAVGAAIIGRKDLMMQYYRKISDAGVLYGDDNIWRLMMFDGIVGKYYKKVCVWYDLEYPLLGKKDGQGF